MMGPLRLSDTLHTNMDTLRIITHGRPERTRLGADGCKLSVRVGKTSMTTGGTNTQARGGWMDASGITTDNLRLVAVEPFHVEALSRDKRELAEVLGVAVPDGWPQFPEAFAPPEDGGSSRSERPPTDWRDYFFVHPRGRALVGNGGFTGEPDDPGAPEIRPEGAPATP